MTAPARAPLTAVSRAVHCYARCVRVVDWCVCPVCLSCLLSLVYARGARRARFAIAGSAVSPSGECWLVLRPEHMRLAAAADGAADHWMACRVEDRAHLGAQVAYRLRLPAGRIVLAQVPAQAPEASQIIGAEILVGFRAADARVLR